MFWRKKKKRASLYLSRRLTYGKPNGRDWKVEQGREQVDKVRVYEMSGDTWFIEGMEQHYGLP